jgi:acetolactate synthase regulatory subunit
MTSSAVPRASAAPVTLPVSARSKAPRAGLWRLEVECRSCTEALPRLFGVLAQHALIPATIDYNKGSDGFAISLVVAPSDARTATLLTGRVERIVSVTKAAIQQCAPV